MSSAANHEAVLEDVLRDDRHVIGQGRQQHELSLQVGGKAGVRQRLDVHGEQGPFATHGDPVVARFHITAHGPKLHDGHAQKSGVDAVHGEGASGKRAADEKGAASMRSPTVVCSQGWSVESGTPSISMSEVPAPDTRAPWR